MTETSLIMIQEASANIDDAGTTPAPVRMSLTGSNHKTAAAWNRGLTLRLLRQHDSLSRQQISQLTRLRGSTLTYIVRELLEKNIVRSVGKRASQSVGQKQIMLTLNPEFGWSVGVSLRPESARLLLLNSAYQRIDALQVPINGALDSVPAQLHRALDTWLSQRGAPPGKLTGIGVGVPAIVDSRQGIVLRSNPFRVTNLPLAKLMQEEFRVCSVVDHDACFGATGEALGGSAKDASHFLYLSVNYSKREETVVLNAYGSALCIANNIYRGAFYGAGELASPLAPPLIEMRQEELDALQSQTADLPPIAPDLAREIGRSLACLVNFIDVETVVLSGTTNLRNPQFIKLLQQTMDAQLIAMPGRVVSIVPGALGIDAPAHGAATTAFDAALAANGFHATDESNAFPATEGIV